MRFFRIPSFTGIEAHRDDADRGSLRMVEGCLPHGPGGLRSGPVWKKIGDVSKYSTTETNHVTAADDGGGNSLLFVSRNNEVHDLAVLSTENTEVQTFGDTYDVAIPEVSLYNAGPANLTPIGNRIYAVGDGSYEAMFVGKGPENIVLKSGVAPDEDLYEQEWSRFPKCQYFVQGPKKTIFASGNPDRPLTVYISEPAGITAPFRDTPYSSEDTTYNVGQLSTVEILGSNASKITALSTRGDQVVVHTDKGCHLLYAPAPDQANTGYRVEQAPATNFSAAVNSKVVSRASGALTYWVGHDGQVYKDEAASRGSEDLRSRADEDQANWKSKGVWENELPTDLTRSFAVYSPQTGMYWFFVESEEKKTFDLIPRTPMRGPFGLIARILAPFFGPTSLDAYVLPPDSGPTNLTASVNRPRLGSTNLRARVLPPDTGPTDLIAEVLRPNSGPTNLIANLLEPTGGPTNLTALVIKPEEGPTGLFAKVLPPSSGPTDLLADSIAEVLPPNEGPTDLLAEVLPPEFGPSDLLAEVLPPNEGPTNLLAEVLPPEFGPTGLSAIEILGPYSVTIENINSNPFSSKTAISSYENISVGSSGEFSWRSTYSSNTGQITTLNLTAEINHPAVTAYFQKFHIPIEVTFNPGFDPYWDSTNRWYYGSRIEGLIFNQNAQVNIIWSDNPAPPYLGPTGLVAAEETSEPSSNSPSIIFTIREEDVFVNAFDGGWQGDTLGYNNPGGLVKVKETLPNGADGWNFSHNGYQWIELGKGLGTITSVIKFGVIARVDEAWFLDDTIYEVSAEENPGWTFVGWDINHTTETPESERWPNLGSQKGEVKILSGSLSTKSIVLKVTDSSWYVDVNAVFEKTPDPDPDPDPVNDPMYYLDNCLCVSDNGSGTGDFTTFQECEDWKAVATFNCENGECVEDDMQMGTYLTCEECQANCSGPCDDEYPDYTFDCTYAPGEGVLTECDCDMSNP